MHRKSVILLFIGLGLLLFASCKKVPIICPDTFIENCAGKYETRSDTYTQDIYKGDLTPPCVLGIVYVLTNEYICTHPLVNPHNPFEFIYLRQQKGVQGIYSRDLCLYNFCDNSVKVIAQNVAFSLDWSVDNWIIFTAQDGQLWKTKSDGTQLTQLTNTGNSNNHAKWNLDGTKYLYYDSNLGPGKMRISYADGTLDRILDVSMSRWLWINDEEIIFSSFGTILTINKYNLATESFVNLMTLPGTSALFYKKDNSIYITTKYGFYEMINENIHMIDTSYQSYGAGYVQPISDNFLLLERTISDTSAYAQCTIYQTKYISLYNRNTQEEKWVKLPQ